MAGVLAVLPTTDSDDSEATKVYSTASWPGEYVEAQIPNPTATGSVLTDQQIQAATADLFQTVGVTSPPAEAPAEPTAVEPEVEAASAQYPTAVVAGCPALIVDTFGDQANNACIVMYCESGGDSSATGDHGSSLGLFQINTGWSGPAGPYGWASWYGVPVEALYDPATNIAVAKAVLDYRGRWGGKGGWTCADLHGIW